MKPVFAHLEKPKDGVYSHCDNITQFLSTAHLMMEGAMGDIHTLSVIFNASVRIVALGLRSSGGLTAAVVLKN